ncbi:MAG: segregation/condensation protein A [Thermodesulfobacteriota bacterium]
MSYNVKLEIFEGPLDLLLHLIKKQEVDIYDISVSNITEQYLEYVEMIKGMDLDLAGEFLVMAATLVHIKSKMLLPLPEEGEEEEEGHDPREDLIKKLLIYRSFKEAALDISQRLVLGRDVFTRGMPFPPGEMESPEDEVLMDATLFDLVGALRDMLKRAPKAHEIDFTADRFRVTDKVNHIMEVLGREKSVIFTDLFNPNSTRGEIIATFLATLELARMLLIRIHQSGEGEIRIYQTSGEVRPGEII